MTDEKSTTPETAKPEPTLTNPVEQSFAEAERLAEQAEAAAKDEPCCDMPKAEEAAPEAPKTEVPSGIPVATVAVNGGANAAAVSAAAIHLCGLHRTAAAAHPAGGRGRLPPPALHGAVPGERQ